MGAVMDVIKKVAWKINGTGKQNLHYMFLKRPRIRNRKICEPYVGVLFDKSEKCDKNIFSRCAW